MTNAARSFDRIAFVASTNEEAEAARKGLAARYGDAARFEIGRRDAGTLVTVAVPAARADHPVSV